MKVAMELVDNIGELTGVGPITKLIKLIINAASTARNQNRICHKFARWLEMMEGLLKPLLKVPKLMEHPETRAPLKQLEESLRQAYLLVIKYKDRSYPYRFIMGSDIAKKFGDMRKEIKDHINLIPLIELFVKHTIHRVDRHNHDKGEKKGHNKKNNKKKGKNREEMGHKRGKDMERKMDHKKEKNKGTEKEKKGVEDKVKEKERNKVKDTEKGKEEKQRGKEKDTRNKNKMEKLCKEQNVKNKEKRRDKEKKAEMENRQDKKNKEDKKRNTEKDDKKNVFEVAKTTVLKVVMPCECDGCPGRINHSIRKYPGVESMVMEVDKGIANVTVVGHLDAKMLRDHVSKETKKEVHLLGNGGTDRENHQVLKKTDSKGIGDRGKPPKDGKNNTKKRVVPMMVAATVVLKVGDTGLRCECNGCVDKICDTLFKSTGVQKVDIDTDKNQVTVTGTNMDVENLREKLGNKVRRPVEVMQPGMD